MNIPIISGLFNFITEVATDFAELRRTKVEGKILVETASAKARASILVSNAQSVAAWEKIQATNSGSSWKDEFWTILIALPIPFAFIPQTRQAVSDGFEALTGLPEWYLGAIGLSLAASFGIRAGLPDLFTRLFSGKAARNG